MRQAVRDFFEFMFGGEDPRYTEPVTRPKGWPPIPKPLPDLPQAPPRPHPISELPEAERVDVVSLQPGDVVVIEFPGLVSDETATRIKGLCEKELFPDNRVMVIGDGGHVRVMERVEKKVSNPPPPPEDVGGLAKKGI